MRYAVLSDIHGNMPAFEAVLHDLEQRAVDTLIYLGDAVGYYAEAEAVIDALAQRAAVHPCYVNGQQTMKPLWVAGNHELGMIEQTNGTTGIAEDAWRTWQCTRTHLPADKLQLLADLPLRIETELADGLSVTIVHASPINGEMTNGYITNPEQARQAGQAFEAQICLSGHTHYPRIYQTKEQPSLFGNEWEQFDIGPIHKPEEPFAFGERRAILNPGGVGQPRDGNPLASYGVLDTATRTFTVHRVAYDISQMQQRVRSWLAACFAPDVVHRLCEGDKPGTGLSSRLERGI
jgi:predicted phosphodiesterase